MHYGFPITPSGRAGYPPYTQWSGENRFLSPPECEALIRLGESIPLGPASVGNPSNHRVDSGVRQVSMRALNFEEECEWLFQRIVQRAKWANEAHYGFDLVGLVEPPQFLRYTEAEGTQPAGHYDWHQDFGAEAMACRKLSLVINLSRPQDYAGCRLTLMTHEEFQIPYREQGDAVAFPSWTPHCVTPLDRGIRYALVCWIHGPPYR